MTSFGFMKEPFKPEHRRASAEYLVMQWQMVPMSKTARVQPLRKTIF